MDKVRSEKSMSLSSILEKLPRSFRLFRVKGGTISEGVLSDPIRQTCISRSTVDTTSFRLMVSEGSLKGREDLGKNHLVNRPVEKT